MNIPTITMPILSNQQSSQLPTSSRGYAMFTVDWFLNGHPVLHNHDNRQLTINDIGQS
jgi:hypothetical protein